MKKRVAFIVVLVLLLLLLCKNALAIIYNDDIIGQRDNTNINIRVDPGLYISRRNSPDTGQVLVPAGTVKKTNEVEEIVFEYEVSFAAKCKLTVLVEELTINRVADNAQIAVIDVYSKERNQEPSKNFTAFIYDAAAKIPISIRIAIRMPESEAEYKAVKGAAIAFSVVFTADKISVQ